MADRYEKLPRLNNTYEKPYEVVKGDPRVDGPYLEEVRAQESENLRKSREALYDAHKSEIDGAGSEKPAAKPAKKSAPAQKKVTPAKKAPAGKK